MKTKFVTLHKFIFSAGRWICEDNCDITFADVCQSESLRAFMSSPFCGLIRIYDDTLMYELRKGRSYSSYSVTQQANYGESLVS